MARMHLGRSYSQVDLARTYVAPLKASRLFEAKPEKSNAFIDWRSNSGPINILESSYWPIFELQK